MAAALAPEGRRQVARRHRRLRRAARRARGDPPADGPV